MAACFENFQPWVVPEALMLGELLTMDGATSLNAWRTLDHRWRQKPGSWITISRGGKRPFFGTFVHEYRQIITGTKQNIYVSQTIQLFQDFYSEVSHSLKDLLFPRDLTNILSQNTHSR